MTFGSSEVKDIDFRIFVHLVMCKLLPVTVRFGVCFCSKVGKFFLMFLSKLLGGEVTAATAGQEGSRRNPSGKAWLAFRSRDRNNMVVANGK